MATFLGIAGTNIPRVDEAFAAIVARNASLATGHGRWWRGQQTQMLVEASGVLCLRTMEDGDGVTAVYGMPGYHRSNGKALFAPFRSSRDAADALIGSDGRHVVIHESTTGEVRIGVDAMGFTPLYVWSDHELLAFASAPGLLLDSGLVRPRIDAHGLVCALMFGHMALSRTIWEGVTRPNVGRALTWSASSGTKEIASGEILPTDAGFARKYDSLFDEFVDLLDTLALPPMTGGGDDIAVSLSGGLDSRILAGAIQARRTGMPRSLVFGLPHEDEVRCARAVAASVGSFLRIVPPREDLHLAQFRRIARQDTLSTTLWSMSVGASLAAYEHVPEEWLITGTFGDHMAGGGAPDPGYDAITGRYTAERQIEVNSRWGLSPREIARLFPGQRAERIIAECRDSLLSQWNGYPGEEFQRAWLWTVRHRMRFHLAPGGWRQADICAAYHPFGTTPMVRFCAGLPLSAMQKRCLETDYLRRRLPRLAALPLDRNSGNLMPLVPSFTYRVGNTVRGAISSRFPKLLPSRPDRRTYHRTFDFDGPGWRPVRDALESLRNGSRIFERSTLDELLPPPSETRHREDAIIDGGRSKNLLALLFVLNEFNADPMEVMGS